MKNLIKNSFVFLTGSLAAGFGGYLFQLLMGRLLSIKEYGELEAVLSLSVIFSVPTAAISFMVVKYASSCRSEKKPGEISRLLGFFTKRLAAAGLVFFTVFILFSPLILRFLKMDDFLPVFLLGIFVWFGFLAAVSKSVLQGVHNFKHLSLTSVLEVFLKIAVAVFFIALGFGVGGVVGAMIIASLAAYAFSLIPLRRFAEKNRRFQNSLSFGSSDGYINIGNTFGSGGLKSGLIKYAAVSFSALLAFTLLYNTDMVLVKHFFDANQSGTYAALSIMGKIILFVLSPIASVMLPMIGGTENKKERTVLLKNSIFLTAGIGAVILVFYKLFPVFIVRMLFGEKYLSVAPYLFWYGTAMFGAAIVNLLLTYLLFFEKKFGAAAVGGGVVLQAALIYLFHQNFSQIIFSVIISLVLVIAAFAIYFAVFLKPKTLFVETQ